MRNKTLPTVCIDFDGVIHSYSKGWQNGLIYDKPVPGCGEAILKLMAKYSIAIYSTRSKNFFQRRAMKKYLLDIIKNASVDDVILSNAWHAQLDNPYDWWPWTIADIEEQINEIFYCIKWPWFKPMSVLTIDDRAITFNGDWSLITPEFVKNFRPWMQKSSFNNNVIEQK